MPLHEKTVFGGYPFATIPILTMEMAQALAFFGISVILTVYMLEWLGWSVEASMAVFHAYTVLAYVFCIFGGMIADSKLGRFRTLIIGSGIFTLGFILLSLTSLSKEPYGYVIGLVLVALGSSGVRPTVPALGADQFTLEQAPQREYFFGLYYIFRNIGSFIGFIVLPVLRAYIDCHQNFCYPLAFGFPALVMILATGLLCATHKSFKSIPPTGDIITQFFGCIFSALKGKMRQIGEKRDHWLDYADSNTYPENFVEDTKAVLRILVMMTPWPFFWALYDQLGSSWIVQAKDMNGELGSIIIYPDQLSAANSLFIIILIPLVHRYLYPLLNRCNIPNTLCQRIVAGMFVVGGAFIVGGCLQLAIHESNPAIIPKSQTRIRFANTLYCDINIKFHGVNYTVASGQSELGIFDQRLAGNMEVNPYGCPNISSTKDLVQLNQGKDAYVTVYSQKNQLNISKVYSKRARRAVQGDAGLRLINTLHEEVDVKLLDSMSHIVHHMNISDHIVNHQTLPSGSYFLSIKDYDYPLTLANGGLYTIILHWNPEKEIKSVLYEDVPPYKIHIFWQLPQFVLLSLGETFFSVNSLDFTYSQAPLSMKSVLTGFGLLTSAFGNLLVTILSSVLVVENLAYIFFIYASLDYFGMILFAILAMSYTYVEYTHTAEVVNETESDITNFDDEIDSTVKKPIGNGIGSIHNPAFVHDECTRF